MENFLPPVDLVMVEAAIRTVRSPERAVAWLSDRLGGMANNFTATVERADRGFFGDRFVRRVAKGANALSGAAKSVHSGHVRIYLFLGVFVTILSSFLFLWEGR